MQAEEIAGSIEPKKELEPLWTPKQLAAFLSVADVTVYRWLSEKRVIDPTKVVRFGGKVRIPRSEVERLAGIIYNRLKEAPTE